MIHSARPTVSPVANIVFCCFVYLDLKSGDGRTTCAKTIIPTGRDFGLAEWIKELQKSQTAGGYKISANIHFPQTVVAIFLPLSIMKLPCLFQNQLGIS